MSTQIPSVAASPGVSPDAARPALERMDDRLARVERMLSRLEGAVDLIPRVTATVADTVDGFAVRAQERGVDVDRRLAELGRLLERVTAPPTLELLTTLLDRGPQLIRLLQSAENAPHLVATLIDTFDGVAQRLEETGTSLPARLEALVALADRLSSAVVTSASATPLGLWGLLRGLSDPDVQRALGMALHVAKACGAATAAPVARLLPANAR